MLCNPHNTGHYCGCENKLKGQNFLLYQAVNVLFKAVASILTVESATHCCSRPSVDIREFLLILCLLHFSALELPPCFRLKITEYKCKMVKTTTNVQSEKHTDTKKTLPQSQLTHSTTTRTNQNTSRCKESPTLPENTESAIIMKHEVN